MSEFPLRLSPGLPILAEDMQKVRESWELLMEAGAETIHPAHGKPFSVKHHSKCFVVAGRNWQGECHSSG
jgi:hypothetical protein